MASLPEEGVAALPLTVIRIRGLNSDNEVRVGTGFFYGFQLASGKPCGVIISNKHVLCDKQWLEFDFAERDGQTNRVLGRALPLRLMAGQLPIISHPDPIVDLAAVPVQPLVGFLNASSSRKPYVLSLDKELLPPSHVEARLHAASHVLMAGFPTGLMDDVNNLPLIRRGTLATPYAANYLGRQDFVVDIAAFPGSSGSPIFAVFEHTFQNEDGRFSLVSDPRCYLIGVLYEGPMMTANGEIVREPIPMSFITRTQMMIHLGVCIKVSRVVELLPLLEKLIAENGE